MIILLRSFLSLPPPAKNVSGGEGRKFVIGTADRLAGPVEANSEYERWAHTRSIGALVACDSQKSSAGAPDLPGRRAHCDVGLDRLIGIGAKCT